jgi:hypothetical protein
MYEARVDGLLRCLANLTAILEKARKSATSKNGGAVVFAQRSAGIRHGVYLFAIPTGANNVKLS